MSATVIAPAQQMYTFQSVDPTLLLTSVHAMQGVKSSPMTLYKYTLSTLINR